MSKYTLSRMSLAGFHPYGFTLVEMMVVVVMIAILTALAFPSYHYAIRKTKRAEARAALLQLMQQQERYYMLHTSYVAFSAGATDADAQKFKWYSGGSAGVSAYEIRGAACAEESLRDCIVLTATAGTARVDSRYGDPDCAVMSLSSAGMKAPAGKDCW